MLVSVVILCLYSWAYFADVESISVALLIDNNSAILASASLIVGAVSYLWAPRKYVFWGSLIAFAVLATTSACLILGTGGTDSPFIALWMLVAVFSGVFGVYGIAPMLVAATAYLVLIYLDGGLTRDTIISILLAGELPLLVSYLIWHTKSSENNSDDRAYRQLATELSQVANKSEVVINAIADGVIALNNKGIIQLINPAAQQIIGWGKQDALALDYKSVLRLQDKTGHDVTPANDPVAEVLATNKQTDTNTLKLLTNSEKKIMISINVSPVGPLGSGVIIVFRDITKEKAEEREQAEFISTASHEMRTPVASIEGYLGLALNPATAQIDEKARDYINKAHESAQHLGRLFSDLLDVSKAEDGRLTSNPKVVDVVAFTSDIVQGLRPHAEAKGLRMMYKPLPDDGSQGERRLTPVFYANVDNDHLREVISNLVENGIKYTIRGDVTVDVTGDAEHVSISVADSGIGIPKEDQVHLFQKFYRVDNTDTREIGGTGLGLYLSRRLAESMGGRIWVESEYKKGSVFHIEIPRISHEEAMRSIETDSMQSDSASYEPALQEQVPIQQPSVIAPQPIPYVQPAAIAPQQAPQTPQPSYSQPQSPAVAQSAPLVQMRQNTPLNHIELNPNQYTRSRRDDISVPPRQ